MNRYRGDAGWSWRLPTTKPVYSITAKERSTNKRGRVGVGRDVASGKDRYVGPRCAKHRRHRRHNKVVLGIKCRDSGTARHCKTARCHTLARDFALSSVMRGIAVRHPGYCANPQFAHCGTWRRSTRYALSNKAGDDGEKQKMTDAHPQHVGVGALGPCESQFSLTLPW